MGTFAVHNAWLKGSFHINDRRLFGASPVAIKVARKGPEKGRHDNAIMALLSTAKARPQSRSACG
jgi:hypothetical protein